MMLSVGSLTGFIIGAGGFILGYITKTIISYEYESIRETRKQRVREREEWTEEIQLLLTGLRQLSREFTHEKRPNINDWIDQLEVYSRQIERKTTKAPDGIDNELEEELQRLSGLCAAHKTVISDLYIEIYGESEGRDELPMSFEYEEVYEDGDIQTDRLLRHMCEHVHETTNEQISEMEDHLESPTTNEGRFRQIKQLIRQ
jgi:hypothetical protein